MPSYSFLGGLVWEIELRNKEIVITCPRFISEISFIVLGLRDHPALLYIDRWLGREKKAFGPSRQPYLSISE